MGGLTPVFARERPERRGLSLFFTRLARSPSGAIGSTLFAFLILAGFGVSWFTPQNPAAQDLDARIRPPSLTPYHGKVHPLGTDQLGRDNLSRLLVALRLSLLVPLAVVPPSVALGVAAGLVAGYYGGRLDMALMRVVDAQLAIPTLLLMIAVVAALGSGLVQIVLVLVIAGWPDYARVVRVEVLSLKEREFVAAATAIGASDFRILTRHIMPNILPTVLVLATLQLPIVIIWEAALSFLGLGIQPPTPSLGQMLSYSQEVIWQAWWMPAVPGLAISLVVLTFNLLGDRLRDVLDPRLRSVVQV